MDERTGDLINGGGFLLLGLIGTLGLSVAAIDDAVHLRRATAHTAEVDAVLGDGTRGEAAVVRFEDGSTATLDEPARDDYRVGDRVEVWRDEVEPAWVSDSPRPLGGSAVVVVVFAAGYGAVRLTTVLRRDSQSRQDAARCQALDRSDAVQGLTADGRSDLSDPRPL